MSHQPPPLGLATEHPSIFGVTLASPVMTASGTSGHGAELGAFFDLAAIGAVVVKSLAVFEHGGNPAPRLAPLATGMLNSVGLPGPGIKRWIKEYLPGLIDSRGRTVVSIWGRTIKEYGAAARELGEVSGSLLSLELNVSCPNTERRGEMFAHSSQAVADVVAVVLDNVELPIAVKISPNTDRYLEVVDAAIGAGASGVVASNTYLGQAVTQDGLPALGTRSGGGISGIGIGPLSLRVVENIRKQFPNVTLIGVGGIRSGQDALAMISRGADAVQVGTANFVDPRATWRVHNELAALLHAE